MELNQNDLLKILRIIADSPFDEVRLETGQHKLHVQKPGRRTAAPGIAIPDEPCSRQTLTVSAPMLGIFHCATQAGAKISADDVLCSIDVLGTRNPVAAGIAGTVREVLAEDQVLVEYGQPLFHVATDADETPGETPQ